MKKLTIICLLFLTVQLSMAQEKVGFTNVELIMSVMPSMKEVQKQLDTYEEGLNKQVKIKNDYYQQKVEEYYATKQAGGLTPVNEKAMIDDIAKLEVELKKAFDNSDQMVMKKRMELLTPIQVELQKAIDEVTEELGYTYIINQVIGEGLPTILYGKPELDITEAVLKKLGVSPPQATEGE